MDNSYLIHYGVKGMRWGIRKGYTHLNGSLTKKGIKKYGGKGGREKLARDIKYHNTKIGKNSGKFTGASLGIAATVASKDIIADRASSGSPIDMLLIPVSMISIGGTAALGGAAVGSVLGRVGDYVNSRNISDAKLSKEYAIADEVLRRSGINA